MTTPPDQPQTPPSNSANLPNLPNLPDEQPASRTAQPSYDSMGLGRTPGQRGAEILAGLRAEIMNTPESAALARLSGRIVARILRSLQSRNLAGINFIGARLYGMKELARRALPPGDQPATVVEVAAGFSPRSIEFAQAHSHVTVIEVDLPDVVEEKQKRLQRARMIEIPANLSWLSADLGVTPLAAVLEGRQVDVIVAEGLLAYFEPSESIRIARQFRDSLKPGGVFITDLPRRQGILDAQSQSGMRMFSRQAGSFLTIADGEEGAQQLFSEAGYVDVQVHYPSTLAETLNLATPVFDYEYLVSGRNPATEAPPLKRLPLRRPPPRPPRHQQQAAPHRRRTTKRRAATRPLIKRRRAEPGQRSSAHDCVQHITREVSLARNT
ncbi:MAG: methyltransferase domain-containing protein [Chloroflexi bacterium]|nr:methyltransferase domain-containing protein [Chloroflexota bacterium]